MGHLLLDSAAHIRLRCGAALEFTDDGVVVRLGAAGLKFPQRYSKDLAALVDDADLPPELVSSPAIAALRAASLLDSLIDLGPEGSIRVQPLVVSFERRSGPAPDHAQASKFVLASFEQGFLVLEQLRAGVRLRICGAAAAQATAILSSNSEAHDPRASRLRDELYGCHLLVAPGEEDACIWEPHDLLMHSRSRMGRTDAPYGGTWRLRGRIPPPPAMVPASGDTIPLPKLLESMEQNSSESFFAVLERRKSAREFAPTPISVAQLSSLLHHGARVRTVRLDAEWQSTSRPYPSGGCAYELDIYALAHECAGLPPGLYRYLPDSHALELRSATSAQHGSLLDTAMACYAGRSRPQVLLIFAARMARVAYKYESIAYSLVLKHVGVLQQTLCLVSTALGISACPLGGGNSEHFAQAAGVDPLKECSVGEMIIGSSFSNQEESK